MKSKINSGANNISLVVEQLSSDLPENLSSHTKLYPRETMTTFDTEAQKDSSAFQRLRGLLHQEVLREYSIICNIQKIRNKYLDVYFAVASTLGEELFFTVFIPFCAWFISARLCLHYATLLAIGIVSGNCLKNVFLLPRPASPCWVRYKTDDHGLPSTHTISSFTLSTYLFLFFYLDGQEWAVQEYISVSVAFLMNIAWWGSISFSRLYNGLHTPIDVASGFGLACVILFLWHFLIRHIVDCATDSSAFYIPILELSIGALLVYLHPRPPVPSSVLPESTLVIGVASGAWVVKWVAYVLDVPRCFIISEPLLPTYGSESLQELLSGGAALVFARFFLGIIVLALTRLFAKKFFFFLITLGLDIAGIRNYEKLNVELAVKYLNYVSIGIAVGVPAIYLFKLIGINTPLDNDLPLRHCTW